MALHDIRREPAARHVRADYGMIWRFFAKEKISFKKIVPAAGQDWPDIELAIELQDQPLGLGAAVKNGPCGDGGIAATPAR